MSRRAVLMVLIFLALVGCNVSKPVEKPSNLVVVSSLFPISDMVRQIGGDHVEVYTLVPAGRSPHAFEPTPTQVKCLDKADLILAVGAGLDDWLQDSLVSKASIAEMLVITEGLSLIPVQGHAHEGEVEQHHCEASRGDPHVWLDPVLVRDFIGPMIARALCALSPSLEVEFMSGLASFQETLDVLDTEISRRLDGIPQKQFISFHPAWGYFARRYGLEEVGYVSGAPGKEPSARYLADLVQYCRQNRVGVVVTEPQLNPESARVICEEIGGQIVALDPLGGEGLEGRSTYRDLMTYNASRLEEAFRRVSGS